MQTEKINFITSDGVTIAADWFSGAAKKYVLLLHMMPAAKESWREFAAKLREAGFNVLAIDLRGHGESTGRDGQRLDYKKFSDAEHQASRLDVEAALKFLNEQGAESSGISLVGASIGANLALDALMKFPEIKKAAALSPGLDYRGVKIERSVKNLKERQSVYLAASREDAYSFETVVKLNQINPGATTLKTLEGAGHGTNMFSAAPELMDELIKWLNS